MLAVVWLLQRRFSRGSGARVPLGARSGRRARGGDDITVVAKRGIGPKAQVAVVEIGGSRYVLGITEGGVSMLDRVELAPAEVPAFDDVLASHAGDIPRAVVRTNADREPGDERRPEDAAPAAPLPLRRTATRPDRRAGGIRTPNESRPAAMTARDAAHVLRRALGA
ncbi:MAG: flagellar biosynthetic protein FliO [Microbacterium arborescens]